MLIRDSGVGETRQVRASGWGTRSALWRQNLASVLEAELVTMTATEGAAYGAALRAGVGAEAWTGVQAACEAAVRLTARTYPDPVQVPVYRQSYPVYQELYPALKPSFDRYRPLDAESGRPSPRPN